MSYTNYPAGMPTDLIARIPRDMVVHTVILKKNDEGVDEEINIRLWGGATKNDKSTTKLWGPLIRLGGYGLNWKTKEIHWLGLEIDAKNNGPIKDEASKNAIVEALGSLGYCEVRNSSSGQGLHIYVTLATPIPNVQSEKDYRPYRNALCTAIESELNIGPLFDRAGTVLYMWKKDQKPEAYKLLRAATSVYTETLVPEERAQPMGGPGWPMTQEDAIIRGWSHVQFQLFDYLARNDPSFTPDPAPGVVCHAHTSQISIAVRDLGIPGYWSTDTAATDLSHHNCYITTVGNIIRIWRAGNGPANESAAWLDINGRTVAILNGVARTKLCLLSRLHAPSKTDRARGPVGLDVLRTLNIPFEANWSVEGNIQVNTSKVKFIVKKPKGVNVVPAGWVDGATQMTYTLDIDDGLHSRQMEANSVRTETSDVQLQYTRDDSGEMVVYFQNESNVWQASTNDTLLKAYIRERYKMGPKDIVRVMALKYANDVLPRVEMPCVPFGVYEYEHRRYWNVPPTDFTFTKPKGTKVKSRISYIDPSLQELANQCPAWFALYNHIFANLELPEDIRRFYSIETGADYGLLWAAYKVADPLNIVPLLVLTGQPETGKTFFADSFRFFFTGRGAYKVTNGIVSNYPDWLGVVVGSTDDLEEFNPNVITRLKNIGSGDRLEVNPKFKRPSLVGGYLSLIINLKDLGPFPTDVLRDRCTFVPVSPILDSKYDEHFFTSGCRNVSDDRVHARIPNVHWSLNQQAEAFFQYLCSIELPVPVRRYALPTAGKAE